MQDTEHLTIYLFQMSGRYYHWEDHNSTEEGQILSNYTSTEGGQLITRVGLDFVTIQNRILKLNF